MKLFSVCVAVSASLFVTQEAAGSASTHKSSQNRRYVPPPPVHKIYDPQPGPFIVRLNDRGQVGEDQYGVIANAVKAWSGTTLQAFVICYRAQRNPVDSTMALTALKTVSRKLKAEGAQVVVMPSGGLCETLSTRSMWQGSYVEIMGVVRA